MDGATWSMGQSRRHSSCPRPSLPCHLTQPAFDPSCPAPRSQRLCWRPTSPVAALGSLPSFGPCEWSHPSWPPGFGPKNTSGGVTTVPCKWKFSIAQWPLRRGTPQKPTGSPPKTPASGLRTCLARLASGIVFRQGRHREEMDPAAKLQTAADPRAHSPTGLQGSRPNLCEQLSLTGPCGVFGCTPRAGSFEGPWNGHGHPFPKPNPTL